MKLPGYWPQEGIAPQLPESPSTFDPGQLELWWKYALVAKDTWICLCLKINQLCSHPGTMLVALHGKVVSTEMFVKNKRGVCNELPAVNFLQWTLGCSQMCSKQLNGLVFRVQWTSYSELWVAPDVFRALTGIQGSELTQFSYQLFWQFLSCVTISFESATSAETWDTCLPLIVLQQLVIHALEGIGEKLTCKPF